MKFHNSKPSNPSRIFLQSQFCFYKGDCWKIWDLYNNILFKHKEIMDE